MQKTTIQIVLLCILVVLSTGAVLAGDAGFRRKIAFLRSGEIWGGIRMAGISGG